MHPDFTLTAVLMLAINFTQDIKHEAHLLSLLADAPVLIPAPDAILFRNQAMPTQEVLQSQADAEFRTKNLSDSEEGRLALVAFFRWEKSEISLAERELAKAKAELEEVTQARARQEEMRKRAIQMSIEQVQREMAPKIEEARLKAEESKLKVLSMANDVDKALKAQAAAEVARIKADLDADGPPKAPSAPDTANNTPKTPSTPDVVKEGSIVLSQAVNAKRQKALVTIQRPVGVTNPTALSDLETRQKVAIASVAAFESRIAVTDAIKNPAFATTKPTISLQAIKITIVNALTSFISNSPLPEKTKSQLLSSVTKITQSLGVPNTAPKIGGSSFDGSKLPIGGIDSQPIIPKTKPIIDPTIPKTPAPPKIKL